MDKTIRQWFSNTEDILKETISALLVVVEVMVIKVVVLEQVAMIAVVHT